MINYLMLALISSAVVLNASEEMIDAVNSTPIQYNVSEFKDVIVKKGSELFELAKDKASSLKEQFNVNAVEQTVQHAPEIAAVEKVATVKEVPASRFAKVFAKLKSIKNINIKEPVKNGFKYVVSLPVNGSKASVSWIKNNPKKAIALTVAAVGLGYASYALYQQYQAAQEDADNN